MKRNPFVLLVVLIASLALFAQSKVARSNSESNYEIAFASFAPLNTDIFVADANGDNLKPLLAHPDLDYNASFSRDGQWIVFTSERNGSADIYRVHPDGSGLERLTDDPAFDDQAALSPDGKFLAFVSSRGGQADIWSLDLASKKLRNITNHPAGDFRPAWSPDGKWVAFSSDRDSRKPKINFSAIQSTEIYLVRPDGSGLRRVTQTQAFAGSPTWSPDGKRLIFYEAEIDEVYKVISLRRGLRGTTQIAMIDLESNERRALTSGAGEKRSPRWVSQDRIGYVTGGPEGGIAFNTGAAGARGEFNSPSWSADGRQMVFHRDVDRNWPPFRDWHSPDSQFQLTRTGIFPSYSPSGARLVLNDQAGAIRHNAIMVMNADGSGRSILFNDPEKSVLSPAWSLQGDKIAFAFGQFFQSVQRPAVADIAMIGSDGTGLKILTNGAGNHGFPSWSPDGKNIVFRSSGGSKEGLFIINVETREIKELTGGSNKDNFPAWSPLGDRIAFTSYRDGDYEIYTVKPDGADLRRLTQSPGNDAHCAWSPDGKWLAFSSARGGFKDEAALHPQNPQPSGDIYVMRADGSDVRKLTDNQFEEGTPGWNPAPQKPGK